MPSAVRNRSSVRISVRLFIVGVWSIMFGLIMLVLFAHFFNALSGSPSSTTVGGLTVLNLQRLAMDGLLLLYRGSLVTLGVGGLMTFTGGTLIVRSARN